MQKYSLLVTVRSLPTSIASSHIMIGSVPIVRERCSASHPAVSDMACGDLKRVLQATVVRRLAADGGL